MTPDPDPIDTTARDVEPLLEVDLDPDAPVTAASIDLVTIGGVPFDPLAPPPDCAHLSFTQLVAVQDLRDDNGVHAAWRATLKVRCAECGRQMRFVTDPEGRPQAAVSDDRRTLGAIVEPVPADEALDGWPSLGDPREVQRVTSTGPPSSTVRGTITYP